MSDGAEELVVASPASADFGWDRLEAAARAAVSSRAAWRSRALEAEAEVVRLRGALEEIAASESPAAERDVVRHLRAENALLASRAAEVRQRVTALLARLAVLEARS